MDNKIDMLLQKLLEKEDEEIPNVSDVSYLKDILNNIESITSKFIFGNYLFCVLFFAIGIALGYLYNKNEEIPI